ncbi:MAG: hypothetical protein AAF611_04585 [Bacteroidota bacterium]
MKKQNLKSLKLSKKSISNLTRELAKGGTGLTHTFDPPCQMSDIKANTCYFSCIGGPTAC